MADRLENEIVPAMRVGCVVHTDRYIFSSIARAAARGIDVAWIRQIYGFALRPHAIYYLRAGVQDLLPRIVHARGGFDYWESGMDVRLGKDLYESFTRYQARIIRALDRMAQRYGFEIIDASRSPDKIFLDLKRRISKLLGTPKRGRGRKPARPATLAAAREAAEEERLIAAGA
jgi:dTMP kinase